MNLKSILIAITVVIIAAIIFSQVPSRSDQRDEKLQRKIDSVSMEYRALESHDRELLSKVRILRDSLKVAIVATTKSKTVYENIKKTPAVRYSDPQLDSVLLAIYPR